MLIKCLYKFMVIMHCLKELITNGFNISKLEILKMKTELMEDEEFQGLLDEDDAQTQEQHHNARPSYHTLHHMFNTNLEYFP